MLKFPEKARKQKYLEPWLAGSVAHRRPRYQNKGSFGRRLRRISYKPATTARSESYHQSVYAYPEHLQQLTTNALSANTTLTPKPRHNHPRPTQPLPLTKIRLLPPMKRTNPLPPTFMLRMHGTQWTGRQMLRNIQYKTPSCNRTSLSPGNYRILISIPPLPAYSPSVRSRWFRGIRTSGMRIHTTRSERRDHECVAWSGGFRGLFGVVTLMARRGSGIEVK